MIQSLTFWLVFAGIALLVVILLPVSRRRRTRTEKFFSLCRTIGSASKLSGNVYYAIVFLQRQAIDSGRMLSAYKSFERASQFLIEQAGQRRKNLAFKRLLQKPFKMKTRTVVLDDHKIKQLGQRFGRLFRPGPDLGRRSYFVLVFTSLLAEDRGKAVVGIDSDQPPGHPEYCVCPTESSPALIAHEILHLFGARDLEHGDSLVMHRVDRPIEELSVDEKTAYAVGWQDSFDDGP